MILAVSSVPTGVDPDSSLHGPRNDNYVVIKFRALGLDSRVYKEALVHARVCFALHALLQRHALCARREIPRV